MKSRYLSFGGFNKAAIWFCHGVSQLIPNQTKGFTVKQSFSCKIALLNAVIKIINYNYVLTYNRSYQKFFFLFGLFGKIELLSVINKKHY